MNTRLKQIFKIISFYDDCRWESIHNYSLMNFFRDDLTPDMKILTHWLCYITDRQMAFQRIWAIGGFVFSEMIYELKRQKDLNLLNPNLSGSFVEKDGQEKDRYSFISKSMAGNNLNLADYKEILKNQRVKFKPRYLPSDYMSILYTMAILEEYEYCFSRFISQVYHRHKNEDDFIKRILFSLSLLTYDGVGQPISRDLLDFVANVEKANERKKRISNILSNDDEFNKNYTIFLKGKVYEQKRAWCSLRDFLKSPEFKVHFEDALRQEGLNDEDFTRLFSNEALTQLELPGDVWNNSSKFRRCILKDSEFENSKHSLNRILRDIYDNNPTIVGYPEQFDITFDFVSRMCDQDNCTLCPIYKIDNNTNNFNKICLKDKTMYCPIVLLGCNYHNNCVGEHECRLV